MRGGLKEMRGNKLMGNQKKGNVDAVFKDLREKKREIWDVEIQRLSEREYSAGKYNLTNVLESFI